MAIGVITAFKHEERLIRIHYNKIDGDTTLVWVKVPITMNTLFDTDSKVGRAIEFRYTYNKQDRYNSLDYAKDYDGDTSKINLTYEKPKRDIAKEVEDSKPTQQYWDDRQNLIVKEWAYGQAKDFVLNKFTLEDEEEMKKEIRKWAAWFYKEIKE